jgi:hypothetical protein
MNLSALINNNTEIPFIELIKKLLNISLLSYYIIIIPILSYFYFIIITIILFYNYHNIIFFINYSGVEEKIMRFKVYDHFTNNLIPQDLIIYQNDI